MIKMKRVYEPPKKVDGSRFLVERLWPRGIKKSNLEFDAWLKDVAPSSALRKWFSHDVSKWETFKKRYRAELDEHPDTWTPILEAAMESDVTLLFSSRDTEHNNVVVLKTFLEEKLQER